MIMAFQKTMDTLNQRITMQDETIAEMQRPSGASTTHLVLAAQPYLDLSPPAENLQVPNPQEVLAQAQAHASGTASRRASSF